MTITEIKCDYDGRIVMDFGSRLTMLARVHGLHVECIRIDRTRHGYHIIIAVRGRVSMARVVLFQSLLGSDWKREMFNSRRAAAWRRVPAFWRTRANVLYQRHYRGVAL